MKEPLSKPDLQQRLRVHLANGRTLTFKVDGRWHRQS
jgi:hypothetical protein